MTRAGGGRYELLSRAGCHLCDEMARLLDEVLPERGLTYAVVDVDRDPVLCERWGEVVPVLLRDGAPVAKVRLERRRLERILSGRR